MLIERIQKIQPTNPNQKVTVESTKPDTKDTYHPKFQPELGEDIRQPIIVEHAFTTGASKLEIINSLLKQSYPGNWLQFKQFFVLGKGSASLASAKNECAETILSTLKSQSKTQSPQLISGMIEAIKFAVDHKFRIAICSNASANKVAKEWAQVLKNHWQQMVGIYSPDKKKHYQFYLSGDKDKLTHQPTRIDIIGKAGKGHIPNEYPKCSIKETGLPSTLLSLGISKAQPIHFAGNELKDAVAAKVLKDLGLQVTFYFMNQLTVPEAIHYLTSHANTDEQMELLAHCSQWSQNEWPTIININDGHQLLDCLSKTCVSNDSHKQPVLLVDFHGTITDQLSDIKQITRKVSNEILG